jgi:hypothetical protein
MIDVVNAFSMTAKNTEPPRTSSPHMRFEKWAVRARVLFQNMLAAALCISISAACGQTLPREGRTRTETFPIDFNHILKGRINREGQLVGLHHAPSAPKTMRHNGVVCNVVFVQTSPGGKVDVVTARVELRDPETKVVLLEKNSTLFPAAWDQTDIEKAIREAYADAKSKGRVEENGRWEGRTAKGVRIDGYLRYDRKGIATAFPVYVRPRGQGKSRQL